MPTPSEELSHHKVEAGGGHWAARTDRPKRSVFSNFKAEISGPDAAAASEQTENAARVSAAETTTPHSSIVNLQSSIDAALARAFAYRFVAKCFEDPTPDGWGALSDPATHTNLRAAVRLLNGGNAAFATIAENLLAALAPANLQAFTDAYLVTFGHAARGPCPMNEIEYGSLRADALFQPHRLADLAAFYRAFGLEIADDAGERPDHICVELEFMSVLAAKEAWAREHQFDAEPLAVVHDAQKQFLREHLGHWAPAFTRRLEREAGPGPLAALARFTREFVLSECARFGVRPGSEDLLLRPVDEAAESLCTACGISALPPGAFTAT